MEKQPTDQDGKSKTASAVDAAHYPEQHEVHVDDSFAGPHYAEIARLAHKLWLQRGCQEGRAEQDWFDAEDKLRAKVNSDNVRSRSGSGSVQR